MYIVRDFLKVYLFMYLLFYFSFLGVLGLPCCARDISRYGERGQLSSCSAWAAHCFLCSVGSRVSGIQ